jgi:uncharacterized protein YbaP (TraB family)
VVKPKLFLVLAIVCWAFQLNAQQTILNSEALLWEISHDSLTEKSYLFGTMHVQDKRAFDFPDSMMVFLSQCKYFAGELDMDEAKASIHPADLLMPPDISLKTLLLKKEYKVVKKVCRKQLSPLERLMVNKIKPVFISALLTESVLKKEMPYALDEYLQKEASKKGLRTKGLETAEEQMKALETMTLKEQATYLYEEALHFNETEEAMNLMTEWYHNGQLDSLYLATTEDSSMKGEFGDAILGDRNQIMCDRLIPIMDKGPVFCAIGAAHLPGADGVLALLQAKGYRIRPIRKMKK